MPSTARTSPRRILRVATAFAAACLIVLGSATPATASSVLRGCAGQATSIAPDGTALSAIVVPAPEEDNPDLVAGTVDDPFRVVRDGTVQFAGNTDDALTDNNWQLSVFGVPVRNGADPNDDARTVLAGQTKVAEEVPFGLTGLYKVSGTVSSTEGRCRGAFWVRVLGDPTGSLPWLGALGLIVVGVVVLFASRPTPRPDKGLGLDEEVFA